MGYQVPRQDKCIFQKGSIQGRDNHIRGAIAVKELKFATAKDIGSKDIKRGIQDAESAFPPILKCQLVGRGKNSAINNRRFTPFSVNINRHLIQL